jgi:TolA-binding protein
VGRSLVVLLALGTLLAIGCTGPQTRPDQAAFDDGFSAFQARQWQKSVDRFSQYLRSDPTNPARGEVYYYRGQALVHLNRRPEAMTDFQRSVTSKPDQPVLAFSYVSIGNLYYEEGNDTKAVDAYGEAIKGPADKLPMDMLLFRLGASLQRLGKWSTADKYLGLVIERYPSSPAFPDAQRRYKADSFSIQTGAYTTPSAAQQEYERVRAAGFSPRLGETKRNNIVYRTVLVGKVKTFAEAEALARRVSQAGFTALIVP